MTTLHAILGRVRPHRRRRPFVTFDPTSPTTWNVLPPGYSWTLPAPHRDCPCGGRGLHLLSADGTDLTRGGIR